MRNEMRNCREIIKCLLIGHLWTLIIYLLEQLPNIKIPMNVIQSVSFIFIIIALNFALTFIFIYFFFYFFFVTWKSFLMEIYFFTSCKRSQNNTIFSLLNKWYWWHRISRPPWKMANLMRSIVILCFYLLKIISHRYSPSDACSMYSTRTHVVMYITDS